MSSHTIAGSEYKGGNTMMDKLPGMKPSTIGGRRRRSGKGRRTLGKKYMKNCGKTRRRRRTRSRMGGLFD